MRFLRWLWSRGTLTPGPRHDFITTEVWFTDDESPMSPPNARLGVRVHTLPGEELSVIVREGGKVHECYWKKCDGDHRVSRQGLAEGLYVPTGASLTFKDPREIKYAGSTL